MQKVKLKFEMVSGAKYEIEVETDHTDKAKLIDMFTKVPSICVKEASKESGNKEKKHQEHVLTRNVEFIEIDWEEDLVIQESPEKVEATEKKESLASKLNPFKEEKKEDSEPKNAKEVSPKEGSDEKPE